MNDLWTKIKTAKEMKYDLENKINKLIYDFTAETGLSVTGINYTEVSPIGSPDHIVVYIKVSL